MTIISECERPTQTEEHGLWRMTVCRGKEGHCPFALSPLSHLKTQIEAEMQVSGWTKFLRHHFQGRLLPHHALTIAVAACPNACSRPQIQDIGFVAALRPKTVLETCTACGKCQRACREGAIEINGDTAQLRMNACLACGECVTACPINAIEADPLYFRVMVGGRMGRRPRWATELPGRPTFDDLSAVVGRFVSLMIDETWENQRISDVVERLGSERMWEAIKPHRRL